MFVSLVIIEQMSFSCKLYLFSDSMLIGALKFTNTVNKKEDKSEWECKTCKEILQYIADNVETDFVS